MAKSKARKKREHHMRNNGVDVTKLRGVQPDFSTHTRKAPSKQAKLNKEWSKYKGQRYRNGVL